jgi:VIT1/CCC1 family predicted Fe2+/Mn2+ transporter
MRKLSVQRRRVVGLAGSVAAMSGVGPALFHRNHWALAVWLGLMMMLLGWVLVLMVRLRKDDRCT